VIPYAPGDVFPVTNFLDVAVKLGVVESSRFSRFALSAEIPAASGGSLTVQIRAGENQETAQPGILLDFDFSMSGSNLHITQVERYLADSRAETKRLFEGLLTSSYRSFCVGRLGMSVAVLQYDHGLGPTSGRFREVLRPRVETYSYVVIKPATWPPPVLPLFSFTFGGSEMRLRRPLMLRVVAEDGEVFVENDALRIFGRGGTLQAAVESFAHDLVYYWRYYRNLGAEEIAGDAVRLKAVYEELVA
jgi:hypothetical protein